MVTRSEQLETDELYKLPSLEGSITFGDEDYKGRTWDEDNQRWTAFKLSDGNKYAWNPDTSTWTAV